MGRFKMTSKVKKSNNIENSSLVALSSGKFVIGSKQTRKELINSRLLIVIISKTLDEVLKSEIEYLCMMNKIQVIKYKGTGLELASACNKNFQVNVIAFSDIGNSDLLTLSAA